MDRFLKKTGAFYGDRFSKKATQKRFLKQEKVQLATNLKVDNFELYDTPVASVDSVQPGDILSFYYKPTGSQYITLAVSNKRTGTSSCRFAASGKEYYSGFLVDHLSEQTWYIITRSINRYRKNYTRAASYKYIKNLFGVFVGKQHYRTFISIKSSMTGLRRVDLREISKNGRQ